MSIISPDAPVVTLVNVFTVDPADQQRLVELWQRATDEVMRHLPGFVSANVHRSPDARPYLTELSEIGTPAPVLCEVVSVHHI